MTPWLKQDDGMGEHRKTRRLLKRGKTGTGLAAFGLHNLAMLHAAKYLTDGFVDQEFIDDTLDDANVTGKQRAAVVESLVAGGQWIALDEGFVIHDYLDHNPSRAETESKRDAEREKKAAAGRKGAAVRWGKQVAEPGEADSTVLDACQGNDDSGARSADSPVPSRPVPSKEETASVAASGDGPPAISSIDAARDRLKSEAVDQVWKAYADTRAAVLGARSAPKLTNDRRQLIARRLKDWPVEDLIDAVKGWRHFPHNRGENERQTPFCDLELVIRNAANIERFRDSERGHGNDDDLRKAVLK